MTSSAINPPSLVRELKVQVEVTIQDYFSPSVQPGIDCSNTFPPGIKTTELSAADWQAWFQTWLETLRPDISPIHAYELCLRLTNDAEIQALNLQYRQQNRPTDVLAFAALEMGYPRRELLSSLPVYLGDIVISIDTASRQAIERHNPLARELAWLAAHGLLHLLGWDHPEEESLRQMLNQQEILLETIGLLRSLS